MPVMKSAVLFRQEVLGGYGYLFEKNMCLKEWADRQ